MVNEQRKMVRRNLYYYLPVLDEETAKRAGAIVDISPGGFKLDSLLPIAKGQVQHYRLFLTSEIASKPSLVLAGRSKWCAPDYIDPSTYNIGFEIVDLSPENAHVLDRVYEQYVEKNGSQPNNGYSYPWR